MERKLAFKALKDRGSVKTIKIIFAYIFPKKQREYFEEYFQIVFFCGRDKTVFSDDILPTLLLLHIRDFQCLLHHWKQNHDFL